MRGLLPVVPEVCPRGTGYPRRTTWQATAEHPAVAGVPAGLHRHSYYDHITLEAGPAGVVAARDGAQEPVLVVGPWGTGRYAALGLIPGLTSGDVEVPVTDSERELVLSLLNWLADTETK